MRKTLIFCCFIVSNAGSGQAQLPAPPFPNCPLSPGGIATTPHTLASADDLTHEALRLLNAETGSLVAKAVSWFLKPTDSDRRPGIWVIANHKHSATIGWLPIPGAAEYRLVVEPHGASAGLIQQFLVKGSVQKYRFPKLKPKGTYQVYLTAMSDKGVEIRTLEETFHL